MYGVGAVLSHVFPNGVERPIAYASRTSTLAEKGYVQLEKEALSLIYGVNKFSNSFMEDSFWLQITNLY